MEPASETSTTHRPSDTFTSQTKTVARGKNSNMAKFREEWLHSAVQLLRPMFEKAGAEIPELGRAAIGFTSRGGGKSNCVGECWHPLASGDGHVEIFIRPDKADPVEVLGILVHELIHSCLPIGSGHGPVYKALAIKIGLEGKMRHAMPGALLQDVLKGIAAELGPLPHAALDIQYRESAPRKKQKTNMLKAWCEGVKDESGKVMEACDYVCRLTKTHAEKGAPICGVHERRMVVEWPAEDEPEDEDVTPEETESGFKAPPPPVETTSEASEPAPLKVEPTAFQPSPGYRFAEPDEVHPPGQTYKMNIEAGRTEVLLVSPVTNNQGESHGI